MTGLRVALVLLAAALASPAAAQADNYSVYSCRTPAGAVAARDGWTAFATAGTATTDTCATGGALSASMNATHVPNADGGWAVRAPTGVPITGYVLYRWAQVTNTTPDPAGQSYAFLYQLLEDGVVAEILSAGYGGARDLGSPTAPLSDANAFVRSGIRVSTVSARVHCVPGGNACQPQAGGRYGAIFQLYRVALQLDDADEPTFSAAPSGTMFDASRILSGNVSASFSARDEGSGLYLVTVEVDNRSLVTQVIDENEGRCRKPFTALIPCKLSASATIGLDTDALAPGTHLVRLLVSDATETNQIAYGPVQITVRGGRGAPNGVNASDRATLTARFAARRRARRMRARFGSAVRLVGRLTDEAGRPIAGATLRVLGRDRRLGGREAELATTTTRSNGSWGYTLRRSPSRILRIGYRSHVNDMSYAATARLSLHVRAAARLSASPRVVRRGSRVRFSGRLLGSPVPRGGKLVDLQAFEAGRWRNVDSVRTRRSGRFGYSYRFVRAAKTFMFRVRIRPDRSYPYALGYSRGVRVRVLP
jgi:hypothetical protein